MHPCLSIFVWSCVACGGTDVAIAFVDLGIDSGIRLTSWEIEF